MSTFWNIIWKWITVASAFASILGVIIIFCASQKAVIISLTFVCIILLALLFLIIRTLNNYIKINHEGDYETIASFAEFRTDNGVTSTYDAYKLIQCKRLILTNIKYPFKWTGANTPAVSSKCQKIVGSLSITKDNWDSVILEFLQPLLYNQSAVVHFHSDNDDTDKSSKPYISLRLKYPMAFLQIRSVITCYPENFNLPAMFERKKISDDFETKWESVASVPFDNKSCSYTYQIPNPKVGYIYRLRWEKRY